MEEEEEEEEEEEGAEEAEEEASAGWVGKTSASVGSLQITNSHCLAFQPASLLLQ